MSTSSKKTPGKLPRGSWIYTPAVLAIYDFLVLRVFNRLVWHCPTDRLCQQYHNYLKPPHLDMGIGTAYFLAHSPSSVGKTIVVTDVNSHCLAYARRRLARRCHLETMQIDLSKPHDLARLKSDQFNSIGLNYVIHCLPTGLAGAQILFSTAARCLSDSGVFFGSTIVGELARGRIPARWLSALFNWIGIFGNAGDDLRQLDDLLSRHFHQYRVEQVGAVALFAAHNPKRAD